MKQLTHGKLFSNDPAVAAKANTEYEQRVEAMGECDCCGQKSPKLETVQIGRHTDRLCPGCIENEVGPECAR